MFFVVYYLCDLIFSVSQFFIRSSHIRFWLDEPICVCVCRRKERWFHHQLIFNPFCHSAAESRYLSLSDGSEDSRGGTRELSRQPFTRFLEMKQRAN